MYYKQGQIDIKTVNIQDYEHNGCMCDKIIEDYPVPNDIDDRSPTKHISIMSLLN
jgi:hypothetical protein